MDTPAPALTAAEEPVVELRVGDRAYRIVLPDAATDYIQGKIRTERQPYEAEMLDDMRARLAPGELVVDVGANVGNHTIYLAAVAGCRVMAFEPNQALCAAIRASVAANPTLPEVVVHACGLGRSFGAASFAADRADNLGAQRLTVGAGEIAVATLDSFTGASPVRAIKIDVEGMELDVLAGASATIKRDRPLLYIECITERDFRAVMRWLEPLDYCYWATFNATPTHLFMPADQVSIGQRIGRLQYKDAQDEYRNAQLLREIRQRLAQAQEREKQARAALDAADAEKKAMLLREKQARTALTQAEAGHQAALEREQQLRASLATVEADLGTATQRLAKAAEGARELAAQRDALRVDLEHSRASLAGAQATLKAAEQARDRHRAESESLLGRLQDSQAQRERVQGEVARLQQSLAAADADRQSLAARLEHAAATAREFAALGERHAQLQRRAAELQHGIDEARSKEQQRNAEAAGLRLAHEQLERRLEVREARLNATERRAAALAERNERMLASASHRVGAALVAAAKSPATALRLPAELWRIYRDAMLRRAARQAAMPEAATIAPPPAAAAAPAMPVPPPRASKPSPVTAAAAPAPTPAPTTAPAPVVARPAPRPRVAARPLPSDQKALKVAAVMDEFTFHAFAPECNLLQLLPANWEQQLAGFAPDLVFIESAWRGADEQWSLKVSNPSAEIMGVIDWCGRHGVPSVFWNKEDPVHFGGFLHIARAVDHVFTTDIDCIARYKREVGHDRVWLLPFAAQPATHNPVERFERQDAFCFAGSYYLKYPERQRDFKSLMDVVGRIRPVEIYDRNFHKPHPHYEFPPEYEQYIVGSLPFDQIDKAYKGYRFGINMNTIKQSQTMFARRVFELLASNTVVVSNFSRGVRLLFGDLVVCSDAPAELERRLTALCADEPGLRKFRLAGVRKILGEHTYAHRLAYVASKVGGGPVAARAPTVTVLAWVADAAAAERVLAMFRAQTHAARRLLLVAAQPPAGAGAADVTVFAPGQRDALREAVAAAAWVAPWSARDHYGPHYLVDLAQATGYTAAGTIGKAAFHDAGSGSVELRHDGAQYRAAPQLAARAAMVGGGWLADRLFTDAEDLDRRVFAEGELFAIDEFGYCRDALRADPDLVKACVDDDSGLSPGLSLVAQLLPMAEAIAPANATAAQGGDASVLPGKSAEELAALLPRSTPSGTSLRLGPQGLELRSRLPADKHAYLYLDQTFARAELNLESNSRYQLVFDAVDGHLDLRTVFEFLDEDRRKISHALIKAGAAYSMAIPARCRFLRFGMRVQGPGAVRVHRLVLADVRERPSAMVPTARHLLVTKQYPAYDDLYRYGFVHSRVRAYRREGLAVDVFRLHADEPCAFREFEGIDVVQGDRDLLDLTLRTGGHDHVLVHLLDASMWEVLERHIDRVKVTVWVHGAEIQTWPRRAFEFERLDAEEIARKKLLSDHRAAFWERLLRAPHPNLSLVFVSNYLAEEAQGDLGVDLSRVPHAVIHNYIDGGLFAYHPKDAAQRTRVLSIRPFASRVYANDLTVRAIELLAQRPGFERLAFHIVGDGELFEETTRPVAGFANVRLERRFLTQPEIAALHREHGIFLCPTRMDTQGVSRDEAMASGLVPVTTRVAAVPEFVDETCGVLVDAEDAAGLADAIERLADDAERFQRLSEHAAQRVREQCGFAQTVGRELALLTDRGQGGRA
jgi:FkbM family methyltransferase